MSEEKEKEELIGVTQAAKELKITRKRILEFIYDQRLPAELIGNSYVIKKKDLILVADRKTGRPKTANPSAAALAKRKQRENQKAASEEKDTASEDKKV